MDTITLRVGDTRITVASRGGTERAGGVLVLIEQQGVSVAVAVAEQRRTATSTITRVIGRAIGRGAL